MGSYLSHARHLLREFRPDIVWACSDAFHAIFGHWLSQECRTKCVIDLYDNFETFSGTKLPAVLPLFKRAVRGADGVTCFSQRLAQRIIQTYPRVKPTVVIESGVHPEWFIPRDRALCRQRLGLPPDGTIIGTAGALHGSRDIYSLFRAFEMLAAENGRLHLAVAGPRERVYEFPTDPESTTSSVCLTSKFLTFINSLDLAVICYRDSAQGRYSFPQKAYVSWPVACPSLQLRLEPCKIS